MHPARSPSRAITGAPWWVALASPIFQTVLVFFNSIPGRMNPMTKWEYATVPLITHATKQILDNWGEDGWELVTVIPGMNPENLVAYMKREVA
ncbi:putative membrane protein [Corynebacterium deserti GIMN1.010]|uniref:Putative membrane protein n=2 Tax=Corynebacterium TaxID=1716 RepID=A0A0M5ILJ5_9CORY|nr:putative membrane protein [Corynebacterium deserti GIMN1.010]